MSVILYRRRASDAGAKLSLPFIIYYITILLQALSLLILAAMPVSANTVDPEYSHIANKTVSAQLVGGTPANEEEFPYVAVIYLDGRLECSGVILSSQWVLTKARCLIVSYVRDLFDSIMFTIPKGRITVGFGSIRNVTPNHILIRDVHIHPGHRPRKDSCNLALIELSRPLPLDGKVRPARITPEIVGFGDELIALGWGDNNGNGQSSMLQKIQLPVGLDDECRFGYPAWDHQNGEFARLVDVDKVFAMV
jgi:hypothetical protein